MCITAKEVEKKENDAAVAGCFIGVITTFIICMLSSIPAYCIVKSSGINEGEEKVRLEAICNGHATWEKDEEGRPFFCWITSLKNVDGAEAEIKAE